MPKYSAIMNKMLHDGLCIATSTFKNYSTLSDFCTSLKSQTDTNFHVFLTDVSPEPKKVDLPSFVSCYTAENKGYASAVNNGIREALKQGYSQFAIVNNDILFDKNFVKNTRKVITEKPKSLIGGKIYYAPGFEYHKDRYTRNDIGNVIWYAGGHIDYNHAWAVHRGVDVVDTKQFNQMEPTGFITGCLMCFDEKLIETIGLMDESYFLYYEDADYSARAIQKDIPLYYDPSLIIWHKNSQSTGGSGSDLHVRYQRNNRLKFALRYAPLRTKFHIVKNFILGK